GQCRKRAVEAESSQRCAAAISATAHPAIERSPNCRNRPGWYVRRSCEGRRRVRCAAAEPGRAYGLGMYNPPLTSSGSRSPEKRRPLPKSVKLMIELMVRGKLDDPDGAPLSFLEAGRLAGLAPHRARQWLDRAEARAYLRSERRSFRESL